MSAADPGTLRIDTSAVVQTTVKDAYGEVVAHRMGAFAVPLRPGIYSLEERTASVFSERLIHVPAGGRVERIDPRPFPCAAPLAGTLPAHPEHRDAAVLWSRQQTSSPAGGTAPSLVVMVLRPRNLPGSEGAPTVFSDTAELSPRRTWKSGGEGIGAWTAWSRNVPAESYQLRWRTAESNLSLALWVEPGWTTVVFVPAGPRGPQPGYASVHMIPRGTGWDPDSRTGIALEVALSGLRQRRCLVGDDVPSLLGHSPFDPMLAIAAAHALLMPPDANGPENQGHQYAALIDVLAHRMPDHPDVRALRSGTGNASVVVDDPPLLVASCRQLLAADAVVRAGTGPVPPGSRTEETLSRLVDTGVWTTWLDGVRRGPQQGLQAPVDEVLDFLQTSARVNGISVQDMAERMGESELCHRTRAPHRVVALALGRLRSPRRTVRNAARPSVLPGTRVRGEGDRPGKDPTVNRAYAALGATHEFFLRAYGRNSLDDNGLPLEASVHYGEAYNNAFWDGERMIYGDGDGEVFLDFTLPLDLTGHELTHGLVQFTADLSRYGQTGALHESLCDVFGSLVKQYALGQTADQADWLIGAGLFGPRVTGVALRSLKAPGTAYDDDLIGRDPQPATMDDYVHTGRDDGGVHINSGITNHAFYLYAVLLGGHAWERAGQVWYDVLTDGRLARGASFSDFARLTLAAAYERYGAGEESEALHKAWSQVGVPVN